MKNVKLLSITSVSTPELPLYEPLITFTNSLYSLCSCSPLVFKSIKLPRESQEIYEPVPYGIIISSV